MDPRVVCTVFFILLKRLFSYSITTLPPPGPSTHCPFETCTREIFTVSVFWFVYTFGSRWLIGWGGVQGGLRVSSHSGRVPVKVPQVPVDRGTYSLHALLVLCAKIKRKQFLDWHPTRTKNDAGNYLLSRGRQDDVTLSPT